MAFACLFIFSWFWLIDENRPTVLCRVHLLDFLIDPSWCHLAYSFILCTWSPFLMLSGHVLNLVLVSFNINTFSVEVPFYSWRDLLSFLPWPDHLSRELVFLFFFFYWHMVTDFMAIITINFIVLAFKIAASHFLWYTFSWHIFVHFFIFKIVWK